MAPQPTAFECVSRHTSICGVPNGIPLWRFVRVIHPQMESQVQRVIYDHRVCAWSVGHDRCRDRSKHSWCSVEPKQKMARIAKLCHCGRTGQCTVMRGGGGHKAWVSTHCTYIEAIVHYLTRYTINYLYFWAHML